MVEPQRSGEAGAAARKVKGKDGTESAHMGSWSSCSGGMGGGWGSGRDFKKCIPTCRSLKVKENVSGHVGVQCAPRKCLADLKREREKKEKDKKKRAKTCKSCAWPPVIRGKSVSSFLFYELNA